MFATFVRKKTTKAFNERQISGVTDAVRSNLLPIGPKLKEFEARQLFSLILD